MRRTNVLVAATALALASAVLSPLKADAVDPPPVTLAVTFDATADSGWLHTTPSGSGLASAIAKTVGSTQTVTRATWTGGSGFIPADVAAVPGVVLTDSKVGVFPSYETSGTNFAGVKVTGSAFGVNDVLAPHGRGFTFGADVKFDSPLPADARPEDNGSNVIQRGLVNGDQYKIQVDKSGSNRVASCYIRETGTDTASVKVTTLPLVASTWYRLRCVREVVGGHDKVTLTVTNVVTGASANNSNTGTLAAADLDYSSANATNPYPLTIGVKMNAKGEVVANNSDQFNGRIDNAYLSIG